MASAWATVKNNIGGQKLQTGGSPKTFSKIVKEAMIEEGLLARKKSFNDASYIQSFTSYEGVRLEEYINLHHLEALGQKFEEHEPEDIAIPGQSAWSPTKYEKREPGSFNVTEFQDTLASVLGTHEFDEQLEKLFTKLDTSCDGYVDWNEFCTYLLLHFRENDYMRTKKQIPFVIDPKIRHNVHNRQETTTKILAVDNPTKFVTFSKEGAICVWDQFLHMEKHYIMADEDEVQQGQKRRFHMWVTDAVFMPNCHKIAVASTSRDIRFYDVTSSTYFEEFHLYSLPNVPQCLDYHYDKQNPNGESMLIYGDDSGAINILYFSRPVTQLFATPFQNTEGVQKVYMQDIQLHSRWVRLHAMENVHPEMVRQVRYMPESDTIISTCADSRCSLIIQDAQMKRKSYNFKMNKGVDCFDYNKNLNILVTGTADHLVRLWNPYVTNKPIAKLQGHAIGVIDVKIHEDLGQIFSYSKDAILKVWDIKEHMCIQTVVVKFPSSLTGRIPEHGPFPMLLLTQAHYNVLLIASNDYVAMLRLGEIAKTSEAMPTTHNSQLCCAIYNQYLKQVVTGSDDSTIASWDVDTGNKSLIFSNAHGNEEITAMIFDNNYRRLITAARDGTIKIWNIQNGHNLNKLEAVEEAEVTGIVLLPDKKMIITVGWSRLITQYDDSTPDNLYIPYSSSWKGGQLHNDDILAISHCSPNLLATASFDGEICVWSLETEKLFLRLRRGQPRNVAKKMSMITGQIEEDRSSRPQSRNSRPNSRHRKSHKPVKGQPVPVDKLLFLQHRYNAKVMEAAILISSEAGVLRWWSIYGQKKEIAYFYAPDNPDESVLGLCSNSDDSLLITGDTQGYVCVWAIDDYAMKAHSKRTRSRPPVAAHWRAHETAIVSVDYIDHDDGYFVVTASTDHTARLWTLEGHYIGTFGQKHSWNLKNEETWAHPGTPWMRKEDLKKESGGNNDSELIQVGEIEDSEFIPTLERGDTLMTEDGISASARPQSEKENNIKQTNEQAENSGTEMASEESNRQDVTSAARENGVDASVENVTQNGVQSDSPAERMKSKSVTIDTTRNRTSVLERSEWRLKQRSHTFTYGSSYGKEASHSILGKRVEEEFARKMVDRQMRRGRFGDLSSVSTAVQPSKFGRSCCPYQVLSTPSISEVNLPVDLPTTPRMISRGYTSASLNNDTLKNMDLSYYQMEAPSNQESRDKRSKGRGNEDRSGDKLPQIRSKKNVQFTAKPTGGGTSTSLPGLA